MNRLLFNVPWVETAFFPDADGCLNLSSQPALGRHLSLKTARKRGAKAAWHFHRHNLRGAGVTDWELLEAVALSGQTTFTVGKRTVTFTRRVDGRDGDESH